MMARVRSIGPKELAHIPPAPERFRDGLFARMGPRFTEGQIVELTLRTALAGLYERFDDALQIGHEQDEPLEHTLSQEIRP